MSETNFPQGGSLMNNSGEPDLEQLRRAIRLSEQARLHGNQPFGAVLVAEDGRVLAEAENAMISDRDMTAHAEMNALRTAWKRASPDDIARATMYASGEPCPMCSGAMLYAQVNRVVFGIRREVNLPYHLPAASGKPGTSCRDIFRLGQAPIEVLGPLLEEEARLPFEAYAARGSR
jgi:tRNA(adenine34) deaminase